MLNKYLYLYKPLVQSLTHLNLSQKLGGATAEIMSDLLAFEADRRAVNITINRYFLLWTTELLINLLRCQFSSCSSFLVMRWKFEAFCSYY